MAENTSRITQFYKNQNVLITGGTGFLGKTLIEKLLRSTDVATIYLLIRERKGKDVHTRLDEIFDNVLFERLKKERPKFKHRVVAIAGDCSITGLGLTITDRQKLISETNIVFHVAATVRFDENLKLSYSINVNGTADVVDLCKHMTNLKSVVHVSTAYSNCHLDVIDETFYDYPVNYEDVGNILQKMTRNEADALTSRIIGKWPNTYTFTKALAESLIRDKGSSLPFAIFRPAIVTSTFKEPVESWIDNLYGPTGACAGAASGLLRVFRCDRNVVADIVPVDTCVAGMVAAAWDVAEKNSDKTSKNIPVYNYVSSVENPVTWEEFNTLNLIHGLKYPLSRSLWTIKFWMVKSPLLYFFMKILFHLIPALIMDTGLFLCGQKPRLFSMYIKIHKFSDVIAFFSTRGWQFKNDNVQRLWHEMNTADRELFPFSMTTVSWLSYFKAYVKGIRVYLMKDPMETLEEARTRMWRFDIAHGILMFLLYFIGFSLIWTLVSNASLFVTDYSTSSHSILRNSTCNFTL